MSQLVIKLIKVYQIFSQTIIKHNALPLVFLSGCKFYPTCSEYTIEEINKFGFWKGGFKGFRRVLKCNPLNQDP